MTVFGKSIARVGSGGDAGGAGEGDEGVGEFLTKGVGRLVEGGDGSQATGGLIVDTFVVIDQS